MGSQVRIPSPPPVESGDPTLIPSAAFLVRNRHWTVPAAVWPFMAAGGFAAHAYGAHAAMWTAAGVGEAAIFLVAPHKWDRPAEQWYARLTVLGAGGWVTAASYIGDTKMMLAALAGLSMAWGVPWFAHKRPRRRGRGTAAVAQWDAWWQHYAREWSLSGSRVANVTSKGVTETVTVKLWAGRQTWHDVERELPKVESALRGYVRHGMVRLEPDPDDPSQVLLHLKRSNPLAPVIAWDWSMIPRSIMDPFVLGIGEGGGWVRTSLLTNWFVIGRSRWGKSNTLSTKLAAITGVPDARAWLIDMKGGRAARPWMPALDWVATTIDEARKMLTVALAEVKARATHADDGEEQLEPTPETPAIFVIIDETHEVTSDMNGDRKCQNLLSLLASQGMGLAVYVIVLTQYGALSESVGSEQTRSNLINRLCFQVARADHGAFALSDYARLDASRLAAKGSFYFQEGPKADSAPARAPHMPHSLVRDVARANGAIPKPPLTLYATEHQQAYDERWARLPEVFRKHAPQWVPGSVAPLPRQEAEDMADDDALARAQLIEDEVAGLPDEPLTAVLARIPEDWEIRRAVDQQKARFARALAFASAGITPKQLMDASGLSRSWVMQELNLLVEDGAITRPQTGTYMLTPGTDLWAAMEAIREHGQRLLAEATA